MEIMRQTYSNEIDDLVESVGSYTGIFYEYSNESSNMYKYKNPSLGIQVNVHS
jgi:hypothetical protein